MLEKLLIESPADDKPPVCDKVKCAGSTREVLICLDN